MATVDGLTKEAMLEIYGASIVDGDVVSGDLVLIRQNGTTVNAGNVRGPQGSPGSSPEGITVDDLPTTGIVSAHRLGGGSGAATAAVPEGTIEGAWASLALGANILDVDAQKSVNGSLIVMHDVDVDRTTMGTGLVAAHHANAIPPIDPNKTVGRGWGSYLHVPTVNEFLSTFGGRAILTIEAKGGIPDVQPLVDLIVAKGLQDSVFINSNNVDVIAEIVSQGMYAHLWAWNDITKVPLGIDAGASLIEVPYNATSGLVSQCAAAVANPAKNLRWFISGPISTRSQYLAMTSGIMGHVTDSVGYLDRASGNAPMVTSIKPSLMAGKRGVGWRTTFSGGDPSDLLDLQPGKGMAWKSIGGSFGGLYLGDMSGTMPGTYTLTFKFVAGASFTSSTHSLRFRFASTIADAAGNDADSNGYIAIINANGRLRLYAAGPNLGDTTALLYEDASTVALTADTEYTLTVNVTPTTVKLSASGGALSKASSAIANTAWRGDHLYIWRINVMNADTFITDFSRT